jgi:hypothetical protein
MLKLQHQQQSCLEVHDVSLSTFIEFYKWRIAVLSGIRPVLYRNEQKNADAGVIPGAGIR